jgi:hypothetical protein
MITFQTEPFEQAYRDAQPALIRHYDEIAENKSVTGPIDPDLSTYKALESTGRLKVLTARKDNEIVGYFTFFIGRNLHYDVTCGTEDIYWLAPEYRGVPKLAVRLFLEAEKIMKAHGVKIATVKTKVANDHEAFFAHLGFRPFERVYVKTMEV